MLQQIYVKLLVREIAYPLATSSQKLFLLLVPKMATKNPFHGRVIAYLSVEFKAQFTALCNRQGVSVSQRIADLIAEDLHRQQIADLVGSDSNDD